MNASLPKAHRDAASAGVPRSTRARRLAATAALVLLAVVLLPDLLFGLDGIVPFVQIVAFRAQLLVVVAVFTVVVLVAAARRRQARPFAAGLLAIVLVAAWMVLPRALAGPPPAAAGQTLTVLTLNTYEGRADVAAVAELIRSERPDLVSLVEAGAAYRSRIGPLVEPLGYRLASTTGPDRPDVWGVTVVVADRFGEVGTQIDTTTPFPMIEVTGGGLGSLRFVGFHSMAPTDAHEIPEWERDLEQIGRWCSGPDPAIVTGDFNATLDHSLLRSVTAGCTDAVAAGGQGLVATWPAWAPRWLGAQIDHVFATEGVGVDSADVREVPGTDHRAVLTRLLLPTGT